MIYACIEMSSASQFIHRLRGHHCVVFPSRSWSTDIQGLDEHIARHWACLAVVVRCG